MNKLLQSFLSAALLSFSLLAVSQSKDAKGAMEEDGQNAIMDEVSEELDAVWGGGDEALEKIKVTGSHIKRIDREGVSPIVVYNKEDLENSGYSSAGDFLRDTTISHFGVSREEAGSSVSGESFTSIKGQESLILINGIRVAEDPHGEAVDLNLIPIFAIERVEILKDGASAIYGSDAIGGVINFITKKDFSGAEIHAQMAPTLYPWYKGGSRADTAVVFGGTHSEGSYIGSIHARFQDSVENYEREWTNETISPTGPYGVFNKQIDPKCPPDLKTSNGCKFNVAEHSTRLPRHGQLYGFFSGDYRTGENTLYTQLIASYKNSKWSFAPMPGVLDIPAGHQMSFGAGQKGELRYRFMEAGKRDSTTHSFIGDLTIGAKGWLSPTWDYDASLKAAHILKNDRSGGLLLTKELTDAIHSGAYDPFNPAKRDLSSALYTAKNSNDSTLILSSLDFTGETGFWDIDLATGFQAYFKNYDQNADKNVKEDKVLFNAGGDGYGDRYVGSYYIEGIKYFSDILEIQLAGRLDYYNDSVASDEGSSDGDAKTKKRHSVDRWTANPKLAFRYKPHSQLLLRGSVGTAFVAPSMGNLNQSVSQGSPNLFDTVACYNELKSKGAFASVYEKLNDRSNEEKDAFIKDFLIEQKDVINQKELSAGVKTELEKLSKSFPEQEYCKNNQIPAKLHGNKNLKETKAIVASLGTHLQVTDEHSLTLDFWHIRKNGIPSAGVGKKTMDAELKFGANYVREKSKEGITINREQDQYNTLSPREPAITTRLINLSSSQISGLDLNWNSDMGDIGLGGGSPYFRDSLSFILSSRTEGFPGIGFVDGIGKWGAPRWRNIAVFGWKNEKTNVSLNIHTVASFKKKSSELDSLPMYTRFDLACQYIYNSKTTFKFGWSDVLLGHWLSDLPIDTDADNDKFDHDIFEPRGPFFFAGVKYKI